MARPITNPYLVYDKTTGEPIIIQRDGYYPPEVLGNLVGNTVEVEVALINSGFYEKLKEKIDEQDPR